MTPRPLPGPEVYNDIEARNMPEDVQGWHSKSPFFESIINEVKPKTIIEVGSWKGASAINMATLATKAQLYCVDTWLGGIDHELNQQIDTSVLTRDHGYPTLYFQFLANVQRAGVFQRVCPIPQTSANGAKLLSAHGIWAELIYIDGSHELKDVYDDICAYWSLVSPGGVMFGDDWGFPGVSVSVQRFCLENNLGAEIIEDNFWVIRKS